MNDGRPGGGLIGTAPRGILTAALILTLAVTAAFYPCLGNGFTTWDDSVYVTENRLIRDLSLPGLGRLLVTPVSGNWHPLTMTFMALEHRLFGPEPRAFHVVSLLLHLANSLLVLRLMTLLLEGVWVPLAAALFFAVHPLRVEGVAWAADQKDLLCTLFFLLSLLLYLSWRRLGGPGRYAISLAAFLLSVLAKATGVLLPPALLLLDFLQRRKIDRRVLAEKVPFLLGAMAASLAAFRARGSYEEVLLEQGGSPWYRLALGGYRLVFHFLPRLAVPGDLTTLNPFYLHPTRNLPPAWRLAVSAAVILLMAWAVWRSARSRRSLAFGLLFFLLTLSPALAVVTLGHVADRFTYLPSVGIAFLAGAVSRRLAGVAGPRGKLPLVAFLVLLAASGILLSRRRCAIWVDGVSIWGHAAALYPGVPQFHNNLGNALVLRGDTTRAIAAYDRALSLHPSYVDTWSNRGTAWVNAGDYGKALTDFQRALALDPRNAAAHYNIGLIHGRRGDQRAAVLEFTRVLETDPRSVRALVSRSKAWGLLGDFDRAITDAGAVILLDPWSAEAWRNRGSAYLLKGELRRAASDLSKALELSGGDPEIRALLDDCRDRSTNIRSGFP